MNELVYFVVFLFLFGSCRKEVTHNYTNQSLLLTRDVEGANVSYNWQEVKSENFISYELYGHDTLIPKPDSAGNIAATLLFETSSSAASSFEDLNGATLGHNYYRIFCRIGNRILSSNTIKNDEKSFIPLPSYNPSSGRFYQLPGQTKILILSSDLGVTFGWIYDYKKKEYTLGNKALTGYTPQWFHMGVYQDKSALFTMHRANNTGNWTIYIYDLSNLSLILSKTINSSEYFKPLFLKNDHLVTESEYVNPKYIKSFNLQTNTVDTLLTDQSPHAIHRTLNPSFMFLVPYRSDTAFRYDVQQDGRVSSNPNYITKQQTDFYSLGEVTNGSEELLLNGSTMTFCDLNFNVRNTFLAPTPPINSIYYLMSSFDLTYSVFRTTTNIQPGKLFIYKNGFKNIHKEITLALSISSNVLIDNDHLLIAHFGVKQGVKGINLLTIDLEP